jgi:flagellum-specific ATP synthase
MTPAAPNPDATDWALRLAHARARVPAKAPLAVEGRLLRMVGLTLEAVGCQAAIGARCLVRGPNGASVEAEVVGFAGERIYLMPTDELRGLAPDSRVIPLAHASEVAVGPELLGRVLDGRGRPLDGRGPTGATASVSLSGRPINPLARRPISEPLSVGVRAINALLTVGRGQRMGLFAGSGVGKSILLGMMTRFTSADVIVVGLIGERGREVKEFIENILGPEGMQRACVVAVPADYPPLMRMQGAFLATAIAEYFRDAGHNVLLLMDSLTRFAHACREIGLAIGEPPATRGYPPSVFARVPQLVERAGNGDVGSGSITAFYTVLTEGDDPQDPIGDAARAILDGHICLSRSLAEAGHYPAIDIEASISRVFPALAGQAQLAHARRFRGLYSIYQSHRDLISVGAYVKGSDPRVDEAIALRPELMRFLAQDMQQAVSHEQSLAALATLPGIAS